MRLSIFTPTHNPIYLEETYQSLKLQNYEDWEWVIVPNGVQVQVPETIRQDARVKVFDSARKLTNIGAIKRTACDHCTGEAFIEVDHDDLLVPGDSLGQIAAKFKAGAGFVYSDTAVFKYKQKSANNYAPHTYAESHGWKSYAFQVYGRTFKASACFPVTPRSLSEIYYCPDHVRGWSRKAYYAAGGHDPSLSVCDDQDLMIKTYLTGCSFEHTGTCNYLYRLHENNTIFSRNKQIQELTRKFRKNRLAALITAWLKREGHEELRVHELRKRDWTEIRDLEKGFGTNRYGHIFADNVLQWFEPRQVREFMNHAYTALIPGGYLTLVVPFVHSETGACDVEWKTTFGPYSMLPYIDKTFAAANGKVACRYQLINNTEFYPSDWHTERKLRFLRFELVALKGQRQPGVQSV